MSATVEVCDVDFAVTDGQLAVKVTIRKSGFADSDESFGPWKQEAIVEGRSGLPMYDWPVTIVRDLDEDGQGEWHSEEEPHRPLTGAADRRAVALAILEAQRAVDDFRVVR